MNRKNGKDLRDGSSREGTSPSGDDAKHENENKNQQKADSELQPQRERTTDADENIEMQTKKSEVNANNDSNEYQRNASANPTGTGGVIIQKQGNFKSAYQTLAYDQSSVQHVQPDVVFKESEYVSWYLDVTASTGVAAPTQTYTTLREDIYSVFEFDDEYIIENEPKPIIEYHSTRSPHYVQDKYNPIDSSQNLIFGASVDAFNYGTDLSILRLNPSIADLMPSVVSVLPSLSTQRSLANFTEQRMNILAHMVNNRSILKIETVHVDRNMYDQAIQDSIPNLRMVSPVLRSCVPIEPIWYNNRIQTQIENFSIKYGKIDTQTDNKNVNKINTYGLPLDHLTTALYNFNLREATTQAVVREDIMALCKTCTLPADDGKISIAQQWPVSPWYDDAVLTKTVYVHCMYDKILSETHSINLDYLMMAMPFTVNSTNKITTLLNGNQNSNPSLIRFFTEQDTGITSQNICDFFASQLTPIRHKVVLQPATVHPKAPEYIFHLLAISLTFQIGANTTGRALGACAARFLSFLRVHYREQYNGFIRKFGFRYKYENGRKVYDPVIDPSDEMNEEEDLLTTGWYPSVFSQDEAIGRIAPTLAVLIADMMRPLPQIPDELAVAAHFPRFPNASHCNPFKPYTDVNQRSTTGAALASTIGVYKDAYRKVVRNNPTSKNRSAAMELFDELYIRAEELGSALDGHVSKLNNVLANFPGNFIENFNSDPMWRPNRHGVVDPIQTDPTKGARIYPLITNEDDSSNVKMVDLSMIWTLLGCVDSAYAESIGNGRSHVRSGAQPPVPPIEPFLRRNLRWLRTVNDIASVEALTLWTLNFNQSIPGYEVGFARLREGINQAWINETIYRNVRDHYRDRLGSGKYDTKFIETLFGTQKRVIRLRNPLIRRIIEGAVQNFQRTVDPLEFEYFQNMLNRADTERMKLALRLYSTNILDIRQGIVLFVQTSPKFDITAELTIPVDITHVTYTPDLIESVAMHNQRFLKFLINGQHYDATQMKDVEIKIEKTGNIQTEHIDMMISAVNYGKNVYINLVNLKYIPKITTDINDFNFDMKLSDLMDKPINHVHEIPFFDNTMVPMVSEDVLASGTIPLRKVWHTSKIDAAMSSRGIISNQNAMPTPSKTPPDTELDMGDLNPVTGMPRYTNGVEKLEAQNVSMYNQVLTLANKELQPAKIQYKVIRRENVIQL
uniref:Major capsid protein n=1 Tax=Elemess virus TaxID=2800913 RepID=A0A894KKS4_9VIRU|nr:MAG: major capsid protein [Elemess virus]